MKTGKGEFSGFFRGTPTHCICCRGFSLLVCVTLYICGFCVNVWSVFAYAVVAAEGVQHFRVQSKFPQVYYIVINENNWL